MIMIFITNVFIFKNIGKGRQININYENEWNENYLLLDSKFYF